MRRAKLFREKPASADFGLASFDLTRRSFREREWSFPRQIRPSLSQGKPQIPILLVAFGMPSASAVRGQTCDSFTNLQSAPALRPHQQASIATATIKLRAFRLPRPDHAAQNQNSSVQLERPQAETNRKTGATCMIELATIWLI
jgi:hypothetical protein